MLQVREQQHPHTRIFNLTGQFNCHTTRGIQAQIVGAPKIGCRHIVLDFSGVTDIDSTGLGELFLWYHHTRLLRIQISIVKPQDHIRNQLDWSHISEIIPIYDSEHEAAEYVYSVHS